MKIAIAGDFLPANRVAQLAEEGHYDKVLAEVRNFNQHFDLSIVNLECPVVAEGATPIEKNGPCMRCGESGVSLIRYGGFDGVTLSNNHFYDYGEEGVRSTLQALDRQGIKHVGGGRDITEASETLYTQIQGETLAVINCSEHEFSTASDHKGGSNPLDPVTQYYAIAEARTKADYVVVIVHGGIEYYNKPTLRMKQTYRFFLDAGADAVINHHQHCVSGYEVYKGKPIFYGLGNFCFDLPICRDCYWNKGYMVGLTFGKEGVGFDIHPYIQSNHTPDVTFPSGKDREDIIGEVIAINTLIDDDKALSDAHEEFMQSTRIAYKTLLTPYSGHYALALCEKGFLPAYYPRKKYITLLNKIECESHRERLIYFIKEKLSK